jgi:hypothetical protein
VTGGYPVVALSARMTSMRPPKPCRDSPVRIVLVKPKE